MHKGLIVAASVLGVLLLGVGVWLAAPLFYDKEVNEELPGMDRGVVDRTDVGEMREQASGDAGEPQSSERPVLATIASGQFEGFDRLHQASGTASIIETNGTRYVRFEEDFTVTNGPDLFVYLGRNGEYAEETRLGRLKGNVGSQNYEIPDSISLDQYDEVWVWCRAFSVPFGKATLR